MEKLPSLSVVANYFDLSVETVTPGNAFDVESVTCPVITVFWALTCVCIKAKTKTSSVTATVFASLLFGIFK